MALKKKVANLDEVAEKFRSLYTAAEGDGDGFVLTSELEVEGYVSAEAADEAVKGLVKNKEDILAELKKLRGQYKDVDVEKYKELLAANEVLEMERKDREAEREAQEREKQKAIGDFDAREKQLSQKHAAEIAQRAKDLEALNAQISALTGSLNQQLVGNAARTALAEAKAKAKGGVNLLMPTIERMTRVEHVDGKHVVRVLGPDGQPRVNAKDEPLTIAELVAEMRDNEEFSGCFEADNRTGSGATGSSSGGGATAYSRSDLLDPAVYRKAKAEADAAKRDILMRE